MTTERYLTVEQVADRMAVGGFTVRRWLRDGRLRGVRPGGRRTGWRIAESDLAAFIARSRQREEPQ